MENQYEKIVKEYNEIVKELRDIKEILKKNIKLEEIKKRIINDLKLQKESIYSNKYYSEEMDWVAWNKAIDTATSIVEDNFYYLYEINFKEADKI